MNVKQHILYYFIHEIEDELSGYGHEFFKDIEEDIDEQYLDENGLIKKDVYEASMKEVYWDLIELKESYERR